MAELVFSTRGQNEVVSAYKAINDAQAAAATGAGQVNQKLRLTAKEAKDLDKLQQEIAKRNETAADTYVRKLGLVKTALAGHKDEARLLKIETEKLTTTYIASAEKSGKLTRQQRAELKVLKEANGKVREELGQVADARDDAYGEDALGQLGQMVVKLGVVGTAVQAVTTGYENQKRAIEAARSAAVGSAKGAGELRQLADSQEEYDRLLGIADRLHASGATDDLPSAYGATFALAGAGFDDEASLKLFERIGQKKAADIADLATSTQVYASSFSREEAGTTRQIMSKTRAAAKDSPGSWQQVQEAIAGVGSAAAPAGISDEEVGAAVATMATGIGTPDQAKTALEAFIFSTESVEGLAGLPLRERVTRLSAMNLSAAELQDKLGRKEAIVGYDKMRLGLGAYDATLTKVQRANTDTSGIDRMLAIREPISETVNMAARARAVEEQREMRNGAAQELITQIEKQRLAALEAEARARQGDNWVGNSLASVVSGSVAFGQTIMSYGKTPIGRLETLDAMPDNRDGLTGEQREVIRLLVEQERAARKQVDLLERSTKAAEDTASAIKDLRGGLVGNGQ